MESTAPATTAAGERSRSDPVLQPYRPTRAKLAVLHGLSQRPMTVSELGRRLDIDKSAVYRHLKDLVGAGLVERHQTSRRRWVTYTLTDQAKDALRAMDALPDPGHGRGGT